MEIHDRIPPQDLEAEITILGSILIDKKCLIYCLENINGEEFYHNWHKKVFNSIKHLFSKDIPIDIKTVSDELKKTDSHEELVISIDGLFDHTVTAGSIGYYVNIIKEKFELRKIIDKCQSTIDTIWNEPELDSTSISSNLISSLLNIKNTTRSGIKRIGELIDDEINSLERILNGEDVSFITTGINDIDKNVVIERNDLISIAARPSNGKSSLAGCIARHLGQQGRTVFKITLDSTKKKEVSRDIFAESGIDRHKFYRGFGTRADLIKISSNLGKLSDIPVYIDDPGRITPSQIYAKCLHVKNITGSLDLLIIDYLQQLDSDGSYKKKSEYISDISRSLKGMTKLIDCPIIIVSQLRRYENEKKYPPQLNYLKESGDIEADLDICFMLWYPHHYDFKKDKSLLYCIVAKNKNAFVHMKKLNFFPEYFKITDRVEVKEDEKPVDDQTELWQDKSFD